MKKDYDADEKIDGMVDAEKRQDMRAATAIKAGKLKPAVEAAQDRRARAKIRNARSIMGRTGL